MARTRKKGSKPQFGIVGLTPAEVRQLEVYFKRTGVSWEYLKRQLVLNFLKTEKI